MKRLTRVFAIVVAIMSMLMAFAGCKDTPRKPPMKEAFDATGYTVTFEDNFDGDSLDTTRWRFFNGKVTLYEQYGDHVYRGGYYSNEPDIVSVKDGNLTISTRYKENGKYGTGWYSSWIETTTGEDEIRYFDPEPEDYKGFNQKYGYFEVRCIAPAAEGLWSAFWLLPDEGKGLTANDIQWTATDGCEIDVMESQNYFRKKDFVQHVAHSDYYEGENLKSDKSPVYIVKDMYSTFHTYGVEWTPDKLIFYIDGYKTYETANIYDGKTLGTPAVPESILLSVELAGYQKENGELVLGKNKDGSKSFVGTLDKMDKSKSYDFVIDYVKVMQKNEWANL